MWALYIDKTLICGTYLLRKDAIGFAEWNYKDKWEKLKTKSYEVVKVKIIPVAR